MFHRIAAALIVLFWLAMTALLVEHRFFPESSRLSRVPAYHIGQIFFQQEHVSDLVAYKDKENIGYMRVSPRSDRPNRLYSADITGAFKVHTADGKHNFTVSAQVDLSPDFKLKQFHADIYVDQNQHIKIINSTTTGVKTFSIGMRNNEERLTYTLDRKGFESLLLQNGMDASILSQFQGASGQMPPPTFTAQEASVVLNGEKVGGYLFSMKLGDQAIIDIHMSQIGQILTVNMPLLGYKLMPYNVSP